MSFQKHNFQFGFKDDSPSCCGGEDERSRLNLFRDETDDDIHDADL